MYKPTKRRKYLVKNNRLFEKQFKYNKYRYQTSFVVVNGRILWHKEVKGLLYKYLSRLGTAGVKQ